MLVFVFYYIYHYILDQCDHLQVAYMNIYCRY
jgi:hypothetical protein